MAAFLRGDANVGCHKTIQKSPKNQRKIPSRSDLGPSWGRLGAVLAVMEPCWAVLGPSWVVLGLSGDRLGAVLRPSWRVLGRLGAVLEPSWGRLGPSWRRLGSAWRRLGASCWLIGASWKLLESLFVFNRRESKKYYNSPVILINLEVRSIDFEAKIVEKSILDGLRSLLGYLKGILEASWGILVAFCELLGLSWATWKPLGGVLGR